MFSGYRLGALKAPRPSGRLAIRAKNRRQLGMALRVLDRPVAEPILQRPRIMPRIRQGVAAGMP